MQKSRCQDLQSLDKVFERMRPTDVSRSFVTSNVESRWGKKSIQKRLFEENGPRQNSTYGQMTMWKAEREARSSEGEVKMFAVKENWEPAEEYKEKLKQSKPPVVHNLLAVFSSHTWICYKNWDIKFWKPARGAIEQSADLKDALEKESVMVRGTWKY